MNTVTQTTTADARWSAIRARLETIRRDKVRELRNYPQPIAGCDVQFNRVAEERDAIFRELERFDAARDGDPDTVDEFLRTSAYFDNDYSG